MGEYSLQIVLLFVAVVFISVICGIFRGLRKYYRNKSLLHQHHIHAINANNRIIVAHIEVPASSRIVNEVATNHPASMPPPSGQVNPPPYSAVSDLPPSYEDIVAAFRHNYARESPPSYKE